MAAASAEPEGSDNEAQPDATSQDDDATPQDEVKRRFKEALDRKRGLHADGSGTGSGQNRSKVHGVHGKVGGQKSFRRKSG
jgi:hypothetical protein